MEYHSSDDKAVAGGLFKKSLEIFGDEIDYVQRYLGFLISINDTNSQCNRSQTSSPCLDQISVSRLCLSVISKFPPQRARPLWERQVRYEYQYSDPEAALKLER